MENHGEYFLYEELQEITSTIAWCVRHQLLINSLKCEICRRYCTLSKSTNYIDGFHWHCYRCKFQRSIPYLSIFTDSKLEIRTIILIEFKLNSNSLKRMFISLLKVSYLYFIII